MNWKRKKFKTYLKTRKYVRIGEQKKRVPKTK